MDSERFYVWQKGDQFAIGNSTGYGLSGDWTLVDPDGWVYRQGAEDFIAEQIKAV